MRTAWLGELLGERCLACGGPGTSLCSSCRSSLRRSPQGPVPKGATAVAAAWAYEGPARALILTLKIRGLRGAAAPLIEGMVSAGRRVGLTGSVVTWVPAHRSDVRKRGFDHAEVLARGLAHEAGLQAHRLIRRRQASRDQASLSAPDRALNVRDAFGAYASPAGVVLVDDLITTGATAAACAHALRAAGARKVESSSPAGHSSAAPPAPCSAAPPAPCPAAPPAPARRPHRPPPGGPTGPRLRP
jgi:predicted amidophosphoribosyltransferase